MGAKLGINSQHSKQNQICALGRFGFCIPELGSRKNWGMGKKKKATGNTGGFCVFKKIVTSAYEKGI
ncbi:MAG: hypothetical protein LPJ89_02580 [Hymenobacteraceae bacterium]|nr:hypothetical protein [Hymenobacteraceae bacterium]MDX5395848.1 hypothetical protein [Hymenobacteraceae bacterium]MDX5442651.1 hypothetical protein [Hymenobacteraceae bacterium]MDX5511903.1 hypothetical protein [Hymenobacteraceae bacterium]